MTSQAPTQGVAEVMDTWARLLRIAPDPERAVGYLADISGLPYGRIDHLRQVRNCCAHPEDGWPSGEDLNRALVTAFTLRQLVLGM